jgi:nitrate reductase gamma subunit
MKILVPLIAVLALCALALLGARSGGAAWLLGVALPYLAVLTFLVGVVVKVLGWARSPVPFRIPTTCGQQKALDWIPSSKLESPHSTLGVVARMALEILFFRSLFRNTRMAVVADKGKVVYDPSKWLWLGSLVFHYSMLLVVVRHLRLFTEPVPTLVLWLQGADGFFQIGLPAVYLTTAGFLIGLGYLLWRRLSSAQLRYISLAADYFPLFLLIGIGTTGVLLRHFVKADLEPIKRLAISLLHLQPVVPAGIHVLFYMHLLLVSVLLVYLPFSKLMHLGGVFLSPTRNLANNNRMVRHINPWNHPVAVHTYEEYEDEFRDRMVAADIPVEKQPGAAPSPAAEGAEPRPTE